MMICTRVREISVWVAAMYSLGGAEARTSVRGLGPPWDDSQRMMCHARKLLAPAVSRASDGTGPLIYVQHSSIQKQKETRVLQTSRKTRGTRSPGLGHGRKAHREAELEIRNLGFSFTLRRQAPLPRDNY